MERNYNSVAFNPEQVKKGLHMDLLKYLISYNSAMETTDYYEIHITSDGYCMIVEFEKVPYDRAYGGTFEYVDQDQAVMTEYHMSDGSYQWFRTKDEYEECEADFQSLDREAVNNFFKLYESAVKKCEEKDSSRWKKITDEDVVNAMKAENYSYAVEDFVGDMDVPERELTEDDYADEEQQHALDFGD